MRSHTRAQVSAWGLGAQGSMRGKMLYPYVVPQELDRRVLVVYAFPWGCGSSAGQCHAIEKSNENRWFCLRLALRQDRCLPLSQYYTSVFSRQQTSVLSQQQTCVLSQQQTSVLSQQQTSDCFGVILGRTKMISTPALYQKWAKWNTDHGAGIAGGATETRPPAAPQSLVPHAPGARIT